MAYSHITVTMVNILFNLIILLIYTLRVTLIKCKNRAKLKSAKKELANQIAQTKKRRQMLLEQKKALNKEAQTPL